MKYVIPVDERIEFVSMTRITLVSHDAGTSAALRQNTAAINGGKMWSNPSINYSKGSSLSEMNK